MREQDIIDQINKIQRDIAEFRSRQILAGDSLKFYDTYSSADYDFSTSLNAGQTKNFELVFTPQHARTYTILEFFNFYRINNSDVMANINEVGDVKVYTLARKPTSTRKWKIIAYNGDVVANDVYMKFYFTGTAGGTWQVNSV